MQDSWSYIKVFGDCLKKIKNFGKILEGAVVVTADVLGLCPGISHDAGIEALRKRLNERDSHKVPTEDTVRNLTVRSGVKNQEQLLPQNLHLLMLASSWIK